MSAYLQLRKEPMMRLKKYVTTGKKRENGNICYNYMNKDVKIVTATGMGNKTNT